MTQIKNDKELKKALNQVSQILNLNKDKKKLESFSLNIKKYEDKKYKFNTQNIDAIDIINFKMEQMNYTYDDLKEVIGTNLISEVFSKRKPLTSDMIKKLEKLLKIPIGVLS